MQRAAWFAFLTLTVGCASHEHIPRKNLVRPTIDDFRAQIHYPYHAPVARQQRMERAAHLLCKGMTEAEVLQVIGPPDYKARWFYPPDTLRGEVWEYVYTWERPIDPFYHGKMISLTLDETVRPRRLLYLDAVDFGVRPPKEEIRDN
jgi:hypothetical protein